MANPKKIAAVVTEYRRDSHADVIVGKVLEGYDQDGGPGPNLKIVSMYVDQFNKGDLSRGLAKRFGFPIFDTIEGALTLGGKDLAVDGVLSIGEHGTYPSNDKGQHLYPRRRFFAEIAKVFERSKKAVPVFNDKHLAAVWDDAKWMYDRSLELFVPFMAGSSLPVTFRRPPLQLPRKCDLVEAAAVGYGGLESYGFHAIETLQCMVERRRGFETGVRSVRVLQGPEMWQEFDRGGWSKAVLEAAIGVAPIKMGGDYRANTAKSRTSALYFIEYLDGFRAVVAMLNDWGGRHPEAFTFAGQIKGEDKPRSTYFHLQHDAPYAHFEYLLRAVDSMFQTGHPAYPVERTLLTSGILDAVMNSLYKKGEKIATPHLAIRYTPTDWPFAMGDEPKTLIRKK